VRSFYLSESEANHKEMSQPLMNDDSAQADFNERGASKTELKRDTELVVNNAVDASKDPDEITFDQIWSVFKTISVPCTSVYFVFLITLSKFLFIKSFTVLSQ
jgi:hypothetical protein